MTVEYPDEPVDGFPAPAREVTDSEGREITIHQLDGDVESLVEMYLDFDSEDRAQGIPPSREDDIREWLDAVTAGDCYNVVAYHEGNAVGHVMLVADTMGGYELAIFVLQAYQGAHIGTELVRTVLGLGQAEGIERVWLTVERWNKPAVRLYEKIGFEGSGTESFEMEMSLRLATE